MNTKINEAIESINKTTELFYQQKKAEGYLSFETTIGLISEALAEVEQDSSIDSEKVKKLSSILMEAMKAIEVKDTILLSDILQYEFIEELESIKK